MIVLETVLGVTALEIDPVQWARSQMAFTSCFTLSWFHWACRGRS